MIGPTVPVPTALRSISTTGRQLSTRPAQEDLVGGVQLGAVDGALDHRNAEIAAHGDDVLSSDPLEDVVGPGRGDQDAVPDDEQVLGAPLADMAVLGQHDGLVVAVALRLALGECTVDVRAGDLAASRDRVVIGPAPRADLGPDPRLGVDVFPERHREDGQVRLQVVQSHADDFARLVEDRADVGILAEAISSKELDGDPGELLGGVPQLKLEEPRGSVNPLEMRQQVEAVELLLLGVPVAAHALEDRRPIIERVGHHADLGLGQRDEVTVEVGPQPGRAVRLGGGGGGSLLQQRNLLSSRDAPRARRPVGLRSIPAHRAAPTNADPARAQRTAPVPAGSSTAAAR